MSYYMSIASAIKLYQVGLNEIHMYKHFIIKATLPKTSNLDLKLELILDKDLEFKQELLSAEFVTRFNKIIIENGKNV